MNNIETYLLDVMNCIQDIQSYYVKKNITDTNYNSIHFATTKIKEDDYIIIEDEKKITVRQNELLIVNKCVENIINYGGIVYILFNMKVNIYEEYNSSSVLYNKGKSIELITEHY